MSDAVLATIRESLPSEDLWFFDFLNQRFPSKVLGEYGTDGGLPLFIRWALYKRSFGQVVIHCFLRADNRKLGVHTHPWAFASFVLRRSYVEEGPWGSRQRRPWSLGFHRADFAHVQTAGEWPCWTLCLMGPRRKDAWAFPDAGVSNIPSVPYKAPQ